MFLIQHIHNGKKKLTHSKNVFECRETERTTKREKERKKCLIHGMRNAPVTFRKRITLQQQQHSAVLLFWDLLVCVCWEMFILCMNRKYKYKSDSLLTQQQEQ